MSALYAATLNTCKSNQWHYREVPDREVIEADFEAYHTKVALHVQCFGDAHTLSVVSRASFPYPPSHRLKVAELLMRTNQELTLGNFEMTWDSADVLYRISNIFPPHRYDTSVIATLVHNSIAEMDRLTPFLAELCKQPAASLILLNIPELLARQELLPPAPEQTETL
jgi:hypothetical protein